MKKIALGQTIGIFANVAVLIGVLLLVYELNQNRMMMQAQTRHSVAEMLISMLALEIGDPGIAEIQVKNRSGEELTLVELERFQLLQEAYWRYRENVHYQYRNGLYDEDEYLALRTVWLSDVNADELRRSIYCESLIIRALPLANEINSLMERPCE